MADPAAKERILVVDDDKAFRVATRTLLEDEGYGIAFAADGAEALRQLESASFDLLLSDLVMARMDGIALLRETRGRYPGLPVIMVTGFGSIATAVEALQLGALDYVTKPCNNAELLLKIRRALESQRKERELRALREAVGSAFALGNMISRSRRMEEVIRLIRQVADTDVTILIRGESGTGKELVARSLHVNGKRREGPFIAVNCSALPEQLLESELFGHEKGAFTGAAKQRIGRFEEADGGTLFLDEIGDVAPAVQAKLLRVLQEKTFERLGGNAPLRTDTRVVAATNRDLEAMMYAGDFREDLYYRLNVFPIVLPPLRERPDDIPLLAEHFLRKHAEMYGGAVKSIAPLLLNDMMQYRWRGNVRELENLVRRAAIKAQGEVITALEFPDEGRQEGQAPPADAGGLPYKEYIAAIVRHAEERYLRRMLEEQKGNINLIARLMDVDRKTIYRKMADYAIDPAAYRAGDRP